MKKDEYSQSELADWLESLGKQIEDCKFIGWKVATDSADAKRLSEAATALRSQQAAGVPVAWRYRYKGTTHWKYVDRENECNLADAYERQPIYTSPAPAAPQGWVSVKERLPKAGDDVLIYHNLGDVERPEVPHAFDVAAYIKGKWIFPWDRDQRNNPPRWVQFWMPLPASPREGGK